METYLPALFPLLFAAGWLAMTSTFGLLSGWFGLQRLYGRRDEHVLLRLRWQSGSMGVGIGYNGTLTLAACSSGLKVSVWRVFGPFQRPFLVPWSEVAVGPADGLVMPRVRLSFGWPEVGSLKVDALAWQRLSEAAPGAPKTGLTLVTRGRAARAYLMQWLAVSVFAGTFFYIGLHLGVRQPDTPYAIICGWPALVFGLATAVRLVRLRRRY